MDFTTFILSTSLPIFLNHEHPLSRTGTVFFADFLNLLFFFFGQNFRFVLGGLSRCFTVPFPLEALEGILDTITSENFYKDFFVHISLSIKLSLSLVIFSTRLLSFSTPLHCSKLVILLVILFFGQNFRFVLGGRSRCSNVPFPA